MNPRVPPELMLADASKIAQEAHVGQKYEGRDFYEAHIVPAVSIVARMGYGPDYQATTYLHDVGEDAGLDRDWFYMHQPNIPHAVSAAVELLNKNLAPSYDEYMRRIARNSLAVVAKFGDSVVNLSTVTFSLGQDASKSRERISKYTSNLVFLRPLLPPPDAI